MVARNHKFARSHGHSRRHEKQDIERWVAEDLETEGNAPPQSSASDHRFGTDVVLDLAPRVAPRPDIDLRGVVHAIPSAPAPESWRSFAQRWARRLGAAATGLGIRLLGHLRRMGRQLFAWISWR